MRDLDQLIAEWRRELSAGGIKSPQALDELESHLREDVQRQVKAGATTEHAFEKPHLRAPPECTQPLRQSLMNFLRSSPFSPLVFASALQVFIFSC